MITKETNSEPQQKFESVGLAAFFTQKIGVFLRRFSSESLWQFVRFSPLILGAFATLQLQEPRAEVLGVIVLVLALVTERNRLRASGPLKRLHLGVYLTLFFAAFFGLSFFFYAKVQNETSLVLLLVGALCSALFDSTRHDPGLRGVLVPILLLVTQMSIFAALGGVSQSGLVLPGLFLIGIIPAFVLSASFVAAKSGELERLGWRRNVEHVGMAGTKSVRPGGISRLFSILLVLMPTFPIVFVLPPFQWLPEVYLLIVFALILTPPIAKQFMEATVSDSTTSRRVLELAVIFGALLFIAGLFVSLIL